MGAELQKLKQRFSGGGGGGGGAPAGGFPGGGFPPPTTAAPATGVAAALHAATLCCALLYLVPIMPRYAFLGYRVALMLVLSTNVLALWAKHPKTFATLKEPSFANSVEVQTAVLTLMLIASAPLPFALMPFLSMAVLHSCRAYGGHPAVASFPSFLKTRVEWVRTAEGEHMCHAFAASSEVIVVTVAPFMAYTQGFRGALLAFFYFRFVARKVAVDAWTAQAVGALTQKASELFHHRWVPAPIGKAFDAARVQVGNLAKKLR